ncbi:type II toxin-antitoxin system VapC family toxin [Spirosoma spitsbergense]|uniref:type II toxin-antitoxin system VapC family toxin n=1 Tax=Spirosoma spitsbergense TaxID=431554 RepID=UPI000364C73A|nr:PIN domain nuclease [Spirosoma spitsbergense]
MGSIIVDTSIWIDYFRGIQNSQTKLVTELLVSTNRVAILPIILQETLQGIRDDSQFVRTQKNMLACVLLRLDAVEAAIEAAQLYRTLRKKGVTIRKPNDCLIAHYALFYDLPVLHNDIDFEQIARHTALRIATS